MDSPGRPSDRRRDGASGRSASRAAPAARRGPRTPAPAASPRGSTSPRRRAQARSTSVAVGCSRASARTRSRQWAGSCLPDVGDDRRIGGRADGAEGDRVLELVDRAGVVPDVGRRRRDRPTERAVGQRERRPADAGCVAWCTVAVAASDATWVIGAVSSSATSALTSPAVMLPFRRGTGQSITRSRRPTPKHLRAGDP